MESSGAAGAPPGAAFREGHVEADGFRIRYREAGAGPPLVHLHGASGLHLTAAHDLLSRRYRVIAFEMPGFGDSPENTRTEGAREMAPTMAAAIAALGLGPVNLLGTSIGAKVALWLALQSPDRVLALVLEGPSGIRPEGTAPGAGSGVPPSRDELVPRLHAHPERLGAVALPDAGTWAKTWPLVRRLRGPDRDADFESRLPALAAPALVLFGTRDGIVPPEMGRRYKELLPNAHLVYVYDAAHAIAADRPAAFAEVVEDFLERHEAFVISRADTVIFP
jgi:pimeloyl-ACP methyl ester carboxylesterase